MTKRELINKYMASINCSLVQGESAEPLLPFLLGDAIYTIYCRDIAKLDLQHREKVIRNHWRDNYAMFNRPFFSAIGIDNHDQITDLMDDFEGYIDINLMQLRSELMLLLQDVLFDRRSNIVSALLCHVLAQAAQIAWGNVYRRRRTVAQMGDRTMTLSIPDKNRYLEAINSDAFRLANIWHSQIHSALIDPNKTKGIPPAINALCRKIYRWVEDNNSSSHE